LAKNKTVVTLLEGGDSRSIGRSNEVAQKVAAKPDLFPELIFGLWHVEGIVRSRAADAIEKITRAQPDLLEPFKEVLLGLLPHARPAAVQWHMAQIVPRMNLTPAEREEAMAIMRGYLSNGTSVVKTFALASLANLAAACDEKTQKAVTKTIRSVEKSGTPAMQARARKLLDR
jgi:hypothetical protein